MIPWLPMVYRELCWHDSVLTMTVISSLTTIISRSWIWWQSLDIEIYYSQSMLAYPLRSHLGSGIITTTIFYQSPRRSPPSPQGSPPMSLLTLSQPGITWPTPRLKVKGSRRSKLESNFFPENSFYWTTTEMMMLSGERVILQYFILKWC